MKLTTSYFPAQTGYEILDITIGELLRAIAAANSDSIAMVDILNTFMAIILSVVALTPIFLLVVLLNRSNIKPGTDPTVIKNMLRPLLSVKRNYKICLANETVRHLFFYHKNISWHLLRHQSIT